MAIEMDDDAFDRLMQESRRSCAINRDLALIKAAFIRGTYAGADYEQGGQFPSLNEDDIEQIYAEAKVERLE